MSARDPRAEDRAAPVRPIGPFTMFLRPPPPGAGGKPRLVVCVNRRPENGRAVSCAARGSEALVEALRREAAARGAAIEIETFRCLGMCEKGPAVRASPGMSWFLGVRESDVPALLDAVLRHFGLIPQD